MSKYSEVNKEGDGKSDDIGNGDGLNHGHGGEDTLSRGNPIAEFLRSQKGGIKDMSQEEFMAKYQSFIKEIESKSESPVEKESEATRKENDSDPRSRSPKGTNEGQFKNIVLKFTTLSEGCFEAPSFTVDTRGAKIGRDKANEICIPSDMRLAPEAHSTIEYHRGAFYIIDGGFSYSASVRIGVGNNTSKKWIMEKGVRFSAGNSIFESKGMNEEGNLEILGKEGPFKGTSIIITRKGATFGRSSENAVSIPDRELSRKHTKIEFDEALSNYIVGDMGSTNGTYVQLVGPYGGKFKLSLNDHILVGRTGFSINRFDYGISEEMGYRQSMEDACTIVQHMNIPPLCIPDLSPQSFFGVFDGHGGVEASHFLAQHLHMNIAHGLLGITEDIFRIVQDHTLSASSHVRNLLNDEDSDLVRQIDALVTKSLKDSFLSTDKDFITTAKSPQNGSTATTALVLGRRLYCANVGDSRTMLSRNFAPILMSEDHKPTREDEAKRIRDAGGFVIHNRVMGELAVSRAFGDVDFKKGIKSIIEQEGGQMETHSDNKEDDNWDQPLIIAEPDFKMTNLTDQDQFLLLACDGLFDVFTPEEIVVFVKENMEKHGDTQRCCQSLTHEAIKKRNSRDNVSVILIILNKWY